MVAVEPRWVDQWFDGIVPVNALPPYNAGDRASAPDAQTPARTAGVGESRMVGYWVSYLAGAA